MISAATRPSEPVGRFCLVLHTHLPWLAHHGSWPVGEEWLYQAWSTSYLPIVDLLHELAAEGRRDLLTLGLTPVLAAQLDDPYCLSEEQTWLGFWDTRALALASDPDPVVREAGAREHRASRRALDSFDRHWRAGGSGALRPLVDAGVIELLGGPAAHPFQPLLDDRIAAFSLRTGLDDGRVRLGARPAGIWAPECGYRPGLEQLYADAGVTHFLIDGPTLRHVGAHTSAAYSVGESDVVVFARDLDITYRVWSPKKGYPGGPWYRDFYAIDTDSGFRRWRVTNTHSPDKAPYEPERANEAALADARDFVAHVRDHLLTIREQRDGRPGIAIAAYDTELFGHWWHEGPTWLGHVLRLLPEAGVEVSTLNSALEDGAVEGRVDLESGSWGSGKDWRVWNGDSVRDLVEGNNALQSRVVDVVDKQLAHGDGFRDPLLDQLVRTGLLALSSDWAFMVTKDTAAQYAQHRHRDHHAAFTRLADAIESAGFSPRDLSSRTKFAIAEAASQRHSDGPFTHLDARLL